MTVTTVTFGQIAPNNVFSLPNLPMGLYLKIVPLTIVTESGMMVVNAVELRRPGVYPVDDDVEVILRQFTVQPLETINQTLQIASDLNL